MLHPASLKFLKALEKNNNKPWFESHRTEYEQTRSDFYMLIENVIKGFDSFDKPLASLETKQCVFRINRDVRFSKNKQPYKNNMAGYFNKDGKKGSGAGYYLHIQPGSSFVAGGIWMPEPLVLSRIRQEIDYNLDAWKAILQQKKFKLTFPNGLETEGKLSRPPKGYEADNPAIEFLKMKNFIISRPLSDAQLTQKDLVKAVIQSFKEMKPVVDFFNTAIE